jgi:hypothetical protein
MPKHREEQLIPSCRTKISRQSDKLHAGRSGVAGADLGISASAAHMADAGAPAASYAKFGVLSENQEAASAGGLFHFKSSVRCPLWDIRVIAIPRPCQLCPLLVGGLNRSPQHFILEGKDGV